MSKVRRSRSRREIPFPLHYYLHLLKTRSRLVSRRIIENRPFVFGIGFHRTGTRSLTSALQHLGYRTIHWPSARNLKIDLEARVVAANYDRARMLEILDSVFYRFDAFTDVPFPGIYRELAQAFPMSKFVLTTREPESWWDSVVRHFDLTAKEYRVLDPFEKIQYQLYPPETPDTVSLADKDVLIAKFLQHEESVCDYFASTDRLLKLTLEDADGYRRLAQFVGRPAGETKFPHVRDRRERLKLQS